jgi:hypothetical protein
MIQFKMYLPHCNQSDQTIPYICQNTPLDLVLTSNLYQPSPTLFQKITQITPVPDVS